MVQKDTRVGVTRFEVLHGTKEVQGGISMGAGHRATRVAQRISPKYDVGIFPSNHENLRKYAENLPGM